MEFATADLCDAFPQLIQVAEPLFREYGGVSRFAGPIDTLRVFEDNTLVRQSLESAGRGRVLVGVDGVAAIELQVEVLHKINERYKALIQKLGLRK